jgi:hypothetical protein
MVINSFSVMQEMGKFKPEQFEKGEVLISLFGKNIEVIKKTSKNEKLIKNQAFNIDSFARDVAKTICNLKETKDLKKEKLQQYQSNYFALLKHVYTRRNSPGFLTQLLTSLHILNPLTPEEKAEVEIGKLLKGKDKDFAIFNNMKKSYIQEKINSRQKQLEKKEPIPGEHFENSLLSSIHETIEKNPNISYSLFIHHDSFSSLTKFSLALPPLLANTSFAENLWNDFLIEQRNNPERSLDDFLREKQDILEESSFIKMAKRLNAGKLNPLEQKYLISQLTDRLRGTLSRKELVNAQEKLENTLQRINDLMQQIPEVIKQATDTYNYHKSNETFYKLYEEDLEKLNTITEKLQDIENFLSPGNNKPALSPHPQLFEESENLNAEFNKIFAKISSCYLSSLEEGFKRFIEKEPIEDQKKDYFASFLPPETLKPMEAFANTLPLLLHNEKVAKSLWTAYVKDSSGITLEEFISKKQKILEEKTFKAMAAQLQKGPIDHLKQGYLNLAIERLAGTITTDQELQTARENFEDSLARSDMRIEKDKLLPTLKEYISTTLNLIRKDLSTLTEPMFCQTYQKDFADLKNLLSQLEDMQIYFFPKEHPKKTAAEQYLKPEEDFDRIAGKLKDLIENLARKKEDFVKNNAAIIQRNKEIFKTAISKLPAEQRKSFQAAMKEKYINSILLHPGFTSICNALQLSREKPLDKAVQDKVVNWISSFLKAEDKNEKLFKYIPQDAGAKLEKYRNSLIEYEATRKTTQNQLTAYIKELQDLLSLKKNELLLSSPKIKVKVLKKYKDKDLKKYTEEFLRTLQINLKNLSQPITTTKGVLPFPLITGMEKKMKEIRKAFLEL